MIEIAHMLDIWGAAMWRSSWQGALAALIVWSVCRFVPSIPARFQCWLWRLVMLKFLLTLIVAIPLELPLLPASEVAVWIPSEPSPLSTIPMTQVATAPANHQAFAFLHPLPLLFVAWLVIVVWQLARILLACRAARQLTSRGGPCEDGTISNLVASFSKLTGLGSSPLLLEVDGQGSPLLVGILRPAIVLPTTTMNQLNAAERTLVIGHEVAHVVRRDLFYSLFATFVRALFFFHPLAWLGERQLRLTQEMAADELAISLQQQSPARYASLLVSVVSKLGPHPEMPIMSLGAAGSHRSLKQRLLAMRFIKQVSSRSVVGYGVLMALFVPLVLIPWSIVAATAATAEQIEANETTVSGTFVSFNQGVLKIKAIDEQREIEKELPWKLSDNAKVISHIPSKSAIEGTAKDAFKSWEAGAAISVKFKDDEVILVEIGVKKTAEKAPEKAGEPEKVGEKVETIQSTAWGKFVSMTDHTLTIRLNSGALAKTKIPDEAKILLWNDEKNAYLPAETAKLFEQVKAGTWIIVHTASDSATVRIGARKGSVAGTFVSFKNDRLLMLGKDLGESFTKKYGNSLHFNKFAEGVPVYESVDGGDYKLIGTAEEVLSEVKEGTIITVHSEGDDNITLIQIGVPQRR